MFLQWLTERQKKALFEALEKVKAGKLPFPLTSYPSSNGLRTPQASHSIWVRFGLFSELMILGFISLLLTFGQSYIARICIPEKVVNTMLPCREKTDSSTSRRRLLWFERRYLAAGSYAPDCKAVSDVKNVPNFPPILWWCILVQFSPSVLLTH